MFVSGARAPLGVAFAAYFGLGVLGCGAGTVTRVIDGVPTEGRFIHPAAYAAFGVAAAAEARGDDAEAARYYAAALALDDASAELWTRLGAVRCRAPSNGAAEEAFAEAEALDPDYGPLFLERALCALRQRRTDAALDAAERALTLDPRNPEVAATHVEALAAAGRQEAAERARVAAALYFGSGVSPPRPASSASLPSSDELAAVDAALRVGELARARRLARSLGLELADLGARAAALGQLPLARDVASAVLGADPENGTARLLLAIVADLTGDEAALAVVARPAPRTRGASPLARLLYAELLARRTTAEAARAFIEPLPEIAPTDALTHGVRERVRLVLATTPPGPPPTRADPSRP